MLFVSLVPSVSAYNIDAEEIGVKKETRLKVSINNKENIENLRNSTKKHIKNQIKRKCSPEKICELENMKDQKD
jgi:hydrogenase maturation factor HypE